MEWDTLGLNYSLVILATILFVITLGKTLYLFPLLFESIFRTKKNIDIENSMRLVRDRSQVFIVMILIFILIFSRYNVFSTSTLGIVPASYQICISISIVVFYLLIRHILIALSYVIFNDKERLQIANRSFVNFFIVFTLLSLCTIFIFKVLRVSNVVVSHILVYEAILFFILFIIRKVQILKNIYNQFVPILYLCILEFLSAGVLIGIHIFLDSYDH